MRKLSKREIIIIGVVAVVLLYGIFAFFWGSPGNNAVLSSALKSPDLKVFTGDVATAVGKDMLSEGEAYAIGRAEAEWLHNPFYEKRAYAQILRLKETAKAGAEVGKKVTFAYTGYMEFGRKKVAIINGSEYNAGEAMEEHGYVLKGISPEKVIIENKIDAVIIEVPIRD
jgi:hypothetical protein